jgi:ABC-type Mn2+/Zn2+ transport system permease subunit
MSALASILAPVSGDFGAATAIELILVGASCGAVGVWVVKFGRAFLAESFTHALLPGLVLAAIAGASLLLGAIVGVVVAYLVAILLQRTPKTSSASATSVTVTLLVAAGALLATNSTAAVGFENLLFGNPLAASNRDIALGILLAVVIAATMLMMHTRFTALAFDAESARTLGVNVGVTSAALLALLVFAVAVAANVAGSLLSLALVTGPALGALSVSNRIGHAIGIAAALGAACGVAGLYLSYYADWPPSACIALLACAAALVPALARSLRSSTAHGRVGQPSPLAGP